MDNSFIVKAGDVIYDPEDGEMWVITRELGNSIQANIIKNPRGLKNPVVIGKNIPSVPWEKISSGTKLITLLYEQE